MTGITGFNLKLPKEVVSNAYIEQLMYARNPSYPSLRVFLNLIVRAGTRHAPVMHPSFRPEKQRHV